LNNSALISDDTKERVWEMARKLNYRPNKVASSLSSGKSYVVGVIVPSAQIQFFSAVINSLEHALQREGYSVLLYQSNETAQADRSGIQTFIEARVDGIIISPSLETYTFDFLTKAHAEGMPIVQFDRIDDELDLPSVAIDDEKGGFIATKHLLDQGYRRIAYISTSSKIQIFRNRYSGYLRALKEYGVPVIEDFVILDELSIQGGVRGARKMISRHWGLSRNCPKWG
jgi:LacI family transcriptional regulator